MVIAREVESVIGMRCEIDEESRKPERDLPGPRSVHTQRLELSCCVEVSLSLWYLTSHDSLPIRPWSIFLPLWLTLSASPQPHVSRAFIVAVGARHAALRPSVGEAIEKLRTSYTRGRRVWVGRGLVGARGRARVRGGAESR